MAQLITTESPRTPASLQEQRHVNVAAACSALTVHSSPVAGPPVAVPPEAVHPEAVHPNVVHGGAPCDRDCPYCWGPETD